MREDPIVAEVHKIRQAIMAEFDHDLDAYFRHIQARQDEGRKQGVTYVSRTPEPAKKYPPDAA